MKKTFCVLTFISISALAFSFDWPVELNVIESIKSFFGQYNGENISTTISIAPPEQKKDEEQRNMDVKVCEEGRVLTVIYSFDDDNDFFPSTLGNAVIIAHDDNIISVYGNLNPIPSSLSDNPNVEADTVIGQIGNSGWQKTGSALEFGIVDSKNRTAINPRTFLPRIEKEGTFAPSDIIMEGKDGKRYDLSQSKTVMSGTYDFYQKQGDRLIPYKITLSLNGDVVDEYLFDMIGQENNRIFVNGKSRKYLGKTIYPDSKSLFLGEARLPSGKILLTFENTNHLGEKRLVNYNLTVY